MLARAGAMVTLIGRAAHVEAINRDGLFIDSIHFQESVRVQASTDSSAVRYADLVLFCVKTLDTESAAKQIAPHLKSGALVLSLQNGVENVDRMCASGVDAIPTVVYVAAAMPAPGRVKHSGRGDLVIGHPTRKDEVALVASSFARAGVPCRITDNISGELWLKLIWNSCGNAASALGRATYGKIAASDLAWEMVVATANEGFAVAGAAGINLPHDKEAVLAGARKLLSTDIAHANSSTAQDVERGKKTEIDALNGVIVRKGKEFGIPTPVNHTLYTLVKLLDDRA
ncbi:MAG: 2-dehydropantoate 2-reductase [Acidobacteria bacterium]|nr:2-dehydropantoate 2-reductase [Acidobacteriota bacterium]